LSKSALRTTASRYGPWYRVRRQDRRVVAGEAEREAEPLAGAQTDARPSFGPERRVGDQREDAAAAHAGAEPELAE
jgi:hypothetical protein